MDSFLIELDYFGGQLDIGTAAGHISGNGNHAGLAGLGDLVVTCFSRHSRNRRFGEMIGAGKSMAEAEAAMTMVVEGVKTTTSVRQLAVRHGIEMPISEAVGRIVAGETHPRDEVRDLMSRDPKHEVAHIDVSGMGPAIGSFA